jgi:hypothetical protein
MGIDSDLKTEQNNRIIIRISRNLLKPDEPLVILLFISSKIPEGGSYCGKILVTESIILLSLTETTSTCN